MCNDGLQRNDAQCNKPGPYAQGSGCKNSEILGQPKYLTRGDGNIYTCSYEVIGCSGVERLSSYVKLTSRVENQMGTGTSTPLENKMKSGLNVTRLSVGAKIIGRLSFHLVCLSLPM